MLLAEATKDTWWVYLVGILISSGAIAGAIPGLRSLLRRRQVRQQGRGYTRLRDVYRVLDDIVERTEAGRAVLLKSHNGGGVPRPGLRVMSTALYESANEGVSRIRDRWKDQPVDGLYAKLLADLFEGDELLLRVKEMKEGALRDLYTADRVHHSKIIKIGCSKTCMVYLSVNFFGEPDAKVRVADRDFIRGAANRLRGIFVDARDIFEESLA